MIETFYTALQEVQAWFFGGLVNDSFIALCLQCFNALLLFSMFYGVIIYPLQWCVAKFLKLLRRVGHE